MNSLPIEILLKIFLYDNPIDFFKMAEVSKIYIQLIDDNYNYMINKYLKHYTFFGLLSISLKTNYTNMLFYLLKYYVNHYQSFFNKVDPYEYMIPKLSIAILEYAINHQAINILNLLIQKEIFIYDRQLKINLINLQNIQILKLCEQIPGIILNPIWLSIYDYRQGSISYQKIYDAILSAVERDYNIIIPIIEVAIYFNLKEVINIILWLTPKSKEKSYDGIKPPVMYYRIIYQTLPENYEIMDYFMKEMPEQSIEWIKNWPRASSSSSLKSSKSNFWKWTPAILVKLLKYHLDHYFQINWEKESNTVLYFDCLREIPDHPLIDKIYNYSFSNQNVVVDISRIELEYLVEYLMDHRYKHMTVLNEKDSNDFYIQKILAMIDTSKPFWFFADFGILIKLAKSTEELAKFIHQGGRLFPFPLENISLYNSGLSDFKTEFKKYNKKINKNQWNKLIDLWNFIPEDLLDYIIRSDNVSLYLYYNKQIKDFYYDLTLKDNIYIPPTFLSKELENLYLADHQAEVKDFLSKEINLNTLIARNLIDEGELDDLDESYIKEDIDTLYLKTIKDLFTMSDLNQESYWWISYLSEGFKQILE